jgi:hypothetical protein
MPFAGSGEVLAVFETKLKNAVESLDFVIVPCMIHSWHAYTRNRWSIARTLLGVRDVFGGVVQKVVS